MLKSYWKAALSLTCCSILLCFGSKAEAFEVPPLPTGNFLSNPWFHPVINPDGTAASSLADWERGVFLNCKPGDTGCALNNAYNWNTSQKDDDPDPDGIKSGKCNGAAYCGTAARYSFGNGQGTGDGTAVKPGSNNTDAFLWQVVAVNDVQPGSKAHFFNLWVTDNLLQFTTTIYGADDANGPWTEIWTPLNLNKDTSSEGIWHDVHDDPAMNITSSLPAEMTLSDSEVFPFYKVEFYCRYTGNTRGCKTTGIYFTIDSAQSNGVVGGVGSPASGSSSGTTGSGSGDAGSQDADGGTNPEASSTTADGNSGCNCDIRGPQMPISTVLLAVFVALGLALRRRQR